MIQNCSERVTIVINGCLVAGKQSQIKIRSSSDTHNSFYLLFHLHFFELMSFIGTWTFQQQLLGQVESSLKHQSQMSYSPAGSMIKQAFNTDPDFWDELLLSFNDTCVLSYLLCINHNVSDKIFYPYFIRYYVCDPGIYKEQRRKSLTFTQENIIRPFRRRKKLSFHILFLFIDNKKVLILLLKILFAFIIAKDKTKEALEIGKVMSKL